MIEFILARYNYWIVIILMMTGLYIVFSRGNLVKTIVGLNLFQTSVFIFYITIGKVVGGTAPILIQDKKKDSHGEGHGDAHSAGHEGDHATGTDDHGAVETTSHATDHSAPLSQEEAAAYISGENANPLLGDIGDAAIPAGNEGGNSLHDTPVGDGNNLFAPTEAPIEDARVNMPATPDAVPGNKDVNFEATGTVAHSSDRIVEVAADHAADTAHHGAEEMVKALEPVIYSNPLPHVLILTAIVVGVATTAVGLAIAVRIREAYGTIEEDALEKLDNVAEFGGNSEKGEAA